MIDIQGRINELLAENGWSLYRLAKESKLNYSTLATIFERNTLPTITTLESICAGFGISIAEFFSHGKGPVYLTDEQSYLLNKWKSLSPEMKKALMAMLDSIDD